MTDNQLTAKLSDRGVVAVLGADAEKLLANLITNELPAAETSDAAYAALLTPQGKILFDFIALPAPGGGVLLDVAAEKSAELAKRLTLYKLRADVTIEDVSATHAVVASWSSSEAEGAADGIEHAVIAFADPRHAALGHRAIVQSTEASPASADAYHAHRIALGVPEGGKDWDFADTFPHEANLDQLKGVSFTKGCYVGQEIVSRMEHRGTARKRIIIVEADTALPTDRPDVKAGDVAIGKLGSVSGNKGLALVRLDRAHEAATKGQPLTAGGISVAVSRPAYATFGLDKATAS